LRANPFPEVTDLLLGFPDGPRFKPIGPEREGGVGNSTFIAVRPHPSNCGIWVAFIAASNTFIVLGV
ncbi:hypothetical protein L195_g010367, partial [Trifolium pratense]